MSGGLMQLVAYGAQDVYLTGNPQITFFKAVHKRHTNFACECIATSLNNNATFGGTAECVIGRNGDLISRMYLRATIQAQSDSNTSPFAWVKNIGYHILDYVELQIGGQKIDKHYGEWLNIWHELAGDNSSALNEMLGNNTKNQRFESFTSTSTNQRKCKVFVPLNFWFNRNVGLALPLIALQYHEVKCVFKFANANETYLKLDAPTQNVTPSFAKCDVLIDYIYLDTEERKRFAQNSHEYLIEQVQDPATKSIAASSTSTSVDLHFNHPCKALYWVNQANHHNDIGTNGLGSGEIWIKNFIIRYLLNDSAFLAHEEYKIAINTSTGATTVESTSGLATLATGCVLNTAYDRTADEGHAHDDFKHLVEALSDVRIYNHTQATITVANAAVDTNLYNIINLSSKWYEIWDELPGVQNQTVASLDTAGTGIRSVFSDVSNRTAIATTSVTSVNKHEFSSGVSGGHTITEAKLKLNGNDRVDWLDAEYFNQVQAFQHHSNAPQHGIYMYCFALNPEDHQPSGTCNFSRIDNAQLELKLPPSSPASQVKVYALNYNVLRIMSGMGGLAYSN